MGATFRERPWLTYHASSVQIRPKLGTFALLLNRTTPPSTVESSPRPVYHPQLIFVSENGAFLVPVAALSDRLPVGRYPDAAARTAFVRTAHNCPSRL